MGCTFYLPFSKNACTVKFQKVLHCMKSNCDDDALAQTNSESNLGQVSAK